MGFPLIDGQTVASIRAGDELTFERLFRAHYEDLYRFAGGYLNDPASAEDIVVGVFGWLWLNRATWTPRTSVESYLYGAVRNRCQNLLRDTRRRAAHHEIIEREENADIALDNDSELSLDIAVNSEILNHALDQLSPIQREVVTLRWMKQMSWDEIEDILGSSRKALQMHHTRAMQKLRQLLEAQRGE